MPAAAIARAEIEAGILASFAHPHAGWASVQLARHLRAERTAIDRALRRLRYKGLVHHRGAWSLTDRGRAEREAVPA